jgi:hypothetical protein
MELKMKLIHSLKKNSKKKEGWSMSAAGAHAVEFQLMGLYGEAISAGDFFLKPFDVFILEFHDLPAGGADEVIVMPLVGHVIVLRLRAEVTSLGQPHFTKEIERPVNGGETDMWVLFRELPIHLFRSDVLILEKHVQNVLALSCEF